MINIVQFKIELGSIIIKGKTSSQEIGLPCGQIQKYISELSKLTRLQ